MTTPDFCKDLNLRFDHASLKPEVRESDIIALCHEAVEHEFYAVAINPVWVVAAWKELTGSNVKILSVSGFPLGAARTDIKVAEAIKGVNDGAAEIDMVANIGWIVSGEFSKVTEEIKQLRTNLPYNIVLKVIIEAGKLTGEQMNESTACVIDGGAQFVKTCTGFFGGATVEQVQVLSEAAGGKIEVKASGGIRTLNQSLALLEAGATRLGSSVSAEIMQELAQKD